MTTQPHAPPARTPWLRIASLADLLLAVTAVASAAYVSSRLPGPDSGTLVLLVGLAVGIPFAVQSWALWTRRPWARFGQVGASALVAVGAPLAFLGVPSSASLWMSGAAQVAGYLLVALVWAVPAPVWRAPRAAT